MFAIPPPLPVHPPLPTSYTHLFLSHMPSHLQVFISHKLRIRIPLLIKVMRLYDQ